MSYKQKLTRKAAFGAGVFCLFLPAAALAGAYLLSAHGSGTIGVERAAMASAGYARGNCGHCHEMHASLAGDEPAPAGGAASGFLLLADGFDAGVSSNPYSQTHSACFQCHASAGSLQSGVLTNYNYSHTFGGGPVTVSSIMDAFNQASYHNLYDIQRYITGVSGTKSFNSFPAGSNPCSGCHNVHLAKANWRTPGNPANTAMSRPSDHNNLWGDDTSERMTAWGAQAYQPLRYGTSPTLLEPDGSSSDRATQAEKTPNYPALCIDCHNATNTIYSTRAGRDLKKFDWGLEVHGMAAAEDWTEKTEVRSPYVDTRLGSYVLSCMDCHEPHGSSNRTLIRSMVNAKAVVLPVGSSDWGNLCSSCHVATEDLRSFHHRVRAGAGYACSACHIGGTSSGNMVACINCHYHGSSTAQFKLF